MFKQYAIGISGRDLIVEGLVSVCTSNIIHIYYLHVSLFKCPSQAYLRSALDCLSYQSVNMPSVCLSKDA